MTSNKPTYTVNGLSRLLGMDRRTIESRFRDAIPVSAAKGNQYDLPTVLTCLAADFLPDTALSNDVDINEAKRRREIALARIAEAEADQVEGRLIPSAVVESTWARIVTNVRARPLSVPHKAAPECEGLIVAERDAVIRSHIIEALQELQTFTPEQYGIHTLPTDSTAIEATP